MMEKAVRESNVYYVNGSHNTVDVVVKHVEQEYRLNICGLISLACMLIGHLFLVFLPVFGFLLNITSLILAIIGYYQEKNNSHIKYQCMGLVYVVIIIDVVEIIFVIMVLIYVIFEFHSIIKYGVSSGLIGKLYEILNGDYRW